MKTYCIRGCVSNSQTSCSATPRSHPPPIPAQTGGGIMMSQPAPLCPVSKCVGGRKRVCFSESKPRRRESRLVWRREGGRFIHLSLSRRLTLRRSCVMLDSEPLHRDLAGSSSVRCTRLFVSVPFDTIYSYPPPLQITQQMDETTQWGGEKTGGFLFRWIVGSGRRWASVLTHGKPICVVVLSHCLFVKPSSCVLRHSANPAACLNLHQFVDVTCDLEVHYKRTFCK